MASQTSKDFRARSKLLTSIKMDEACVKREQEIAQPSLIIAAPTLRSTG